MFEGGEMVFENAARDAYGHAKPGGIGDMVSAKLREQSANCCKGRPIGVIYQKPGYLLQGGDPDAVDSIIPMAYGNLFKSITKQKD